MVMSDAPGPESTFNNDDLVIYNKFTVNFTNILLLFQIAYPVFCFASSSLMNFSISGPLPSR